MVEKNKLYTYFLLILHLMLNKGFKPEYFKNLFNNLNNYRIWLEIITLKYPFLFMTKGMLRIFDLNQLFRMFCV